MTTTNYSRHLRVAKLHEHVNACEDTNTHVALQINRQNASVALTQDVGVAQQSGLVEFGLAEPAGLLGREEDLDCHVLVAPLGLPHLAVATLADALLQRDLLGDRPLHLNTNTQ